MMMDEDVLDILQKTFVKPWNPNSKPLKDLFNANACWLVLIYDTLIITYVGKIIFKYVSYIL